MLGPDSVRVHMGSARTEPGPSCAHLKGIEHDPSTVCLGRARSICARPASLLVLQLGFLDLSSDLFFSHFSVPLALLSFVDFRRED